jgi:deoxyribodipyrimidine photo-lyase
MLTLTQSTWALNQAAALHQLNAFVDQGGAGVLYAQLRNSDLGTGKHQHVSRLSPYLSCRLLLETQVLRTVLKKESPITAEKFIQEICWRTYWKGWLQHNPKVWDRYCADLEELQKLAPVLQKKLSQARAGTTGLECFDVWVLELTSTGYLHNHARMWFASIWIFTLKLPWQLGAQFFMQHLIDADAASNTLSWRWVAGLHTVGKHYVAKADNIARYTNGRFNPHGLLNENAVALTEQNQFGNDQLKSVRHLQSPIPFHKQASVQSGVLILHGADLSPEHELGIEQLDAVFWIKSLDPTSDGSSNSLVANFAQDVMADTLQRLRAQYHLREDQIVAVDSPSTLVATVLQYPQYLSAIMFTAVMPIGLLRDQLEPSLQALKAKGHDVRQLTRQWDDIAWPHAQRGYFAFKARIPQLLGTL